MTHADNSRGQLDSLLRRALVQLGEWQRKYGEHNPQWLPPAGDVRLAEDIDDALATPAPGAPGQEAAAVQAVGAEPTQEMVRSMVRALMSQPPWSSWDDCASAAWKAGVAVLRVGGGSEREWLKCDACGKDMRGHDRMGHCGAGAGEKTS